MSRKKQYIDIQNKLTLNTWKDASADTREDREFQILKNYIPNKGELRTREGITIFSHTPSATGNDFTNDSDVVALYKFENDLTEEINSQNLVPSAPNAPSYSFDSKEGDYAGSFSAANSEWGYVSDANLISGFPGKDTESPTSFSICCWFKAKTVAARCAMVDKFDFSGGKVAFHVGMETSLKPRFSVGWGPLGTNLDFSTALSLNTWYHIGCTYTTGSPFAMSIRVHHADGTLVGGANTAGNAAQEFSSSGAQFEIGRYNSSAVYWDGYIDEVVVFKRALSNADIDKIFNKTFS